MVTPRLIQQAQQAQSHANESKRLHHGPIITQCLAANAVEDTGSHLREDSDEHGADLHGRWAH